MLSSWRHRRGRSGRRRDGHTRGPQHLLPATPWSGPRDGCGFPAARRSGGTPTNTSATTLFAALEVHTGVSRQAGYRRKRRREFLDFMNGLLPQHPNTELHVILDNFTTHKPKHDRWLARHPNVHFHYTPTHASWLNQIEVWFSILTRAVLLHLSSTSPREVCAANDRFTEACNERPVPFEWTRSRVHPGGLKLRYADLRN